MGVQQQLPEDQRPFNRRTWLEIDLDAFRRNYKKIHDRIPKTTRVMLIVKADGYGLGDADIAAAVNDYPDDWLGVCSVNEALNVRRVTDKPILILTYTDPQFVDILLEKQITQTVVSLTHAKTLAAEAERIGAPLSVHIKLDTGMNRVGLIAYGERWTTAVEEAKEILENPWLHVTGVFTHIATMLELDETSKAFREEQVAAYQRTTEELLRQGYNLGLRHVSNSGGVFNMPELAELEMVRVGNVLYNVCPKRFFAQPIDVESVVAFKSTVILVKDVEGGQYFGYSLGGYSEKPIRVATVNAGYADGFRRGLGNIGRVLIHGISCPIISRVCMDQMIVNVSAVPEEVRVGDEVVLIGRQGNEEIEVCEHSGLIQTGGPEITCLFTRRVQRIYIRDGKPAYRVDYERVESPIE